MAITISDLQVVYSGGASNTDPDLSLGGIISSVGGSEVISQLTSALTNVTGVVIDNAYSNPLGAGTIKYDPGNDTLYWKPYSGVQFASVDISAGDGTYVLGDSGGYVVCTVTATNLPAVLAEDTDILVTNKMNNVFDSVSSTESLDGLIEYRCLYIKNTHATDTAYDVRIWVKQQPIGPDELDLSLDLAGTGNGSTTGVAAVAIDEEDSTNQVSGLTWTRPSLQGSGLLLGNLAPGECRAFWEKRTVWPDSTQQVANDTSKIGISVLI